MFAGQEVIELATGNPRKIREAVEAHRFLRRMVPYVLCNDVLEGRAGHGPRLSVYETRLLQYIA